MHLPHPSTRLSSKRISLLIRNGLNHAKAPLLMAVLCTGLTCILVACRSDRRESFYPTLADANKDGAIDRGWIPDFLPESSHAIYEAHDISPSTTWCAFEFLPSDSQRLRDNLKSVDTIALSVRRVPNPGESWWPAMLKGNLDSEKIHQAGLELYMVVNRDVMPATPSTTEVLLFAVDWAKGRGFFYRTYRSAE